MHFFEQVKCFGTLKKKKYHNKQFYEILWNLKCVRLLFNYSNIAEYINKKLFEYFYKIIFKY